MKKTLLLFIVIFTAFFSYSQDPDEVLKYLPEHLKNELIAQSKEKGPVIYKALPAKSTIGVRLLNLPPGVPQVYDDAFKGGSVFIMEVDYDTNICPDRKEGSPDFTFWVLHLNESMENKFTAHQSNSSAALQLRGMMDRYKPAGDFCSTGAINKVESGLGGMSVSFKTIQHYNPRNFQVWEGQMSNSKGMADAKAARDFFRKNLVNYFKYIDKYKGKPHISGIGGNNAELPSTPGDKIPVPAGNETDGDTGWKAIRDGMISLKNAAQALSTATDARNLMSKATRLFGPARSMNTTMKADALGAATSAINLSGLTLPDILNPNAMAENIIHKNVNDMVNAFAEVNKQYADRGDANAKEIQKSATKPINDPRVYKDGIDGDYMMYQLNSAFDALDEIEAEIDAMNLPKKVATGMVWGPGLWQNIQSYGMPGAPVTVVANSVSQAENKAAASPEMLDALKKAGYDIPDLDLDAMFDEIEKNIPKDIEIDINEPLFSGQLHGTKIQNFRGGEWPRLMLHFAVSSPVEVEAASTQDTTIFDIPDGETDDSPEKPDALEFYVATTGNDANPGTKIDPFATIQKAMDASIIHLQSRKPVTIIIKDGVYRQSGEINIPVIASTTALTITSENRHGAAFMGSEPVHQNVKWNRNLNKEEGGWLADLPLHPQQWSYTPGGNPMTNLVPVIAVNGTKLIHLPMVPPQATGLYTFTTNKARVFPQEEVTDLNTATVEVSTRKFALKIAGAGQVSVTDIRFVHFPYPYPNNSPGVEHSGNVSVVGCKFE